MIFNQKVPFFVSFLTLVVTFQAFGNPNGTPTPGEKIGEGAKAKVYRYGDEFVLKVPKKKILKGGLKSSVAALKKEHDIRVQKWIDLGIFDGSVRWLDDEKPHLGLVKTLIQGETLQEFFQSDAFVDPDGAEKREKLKQLLESLIEHGVFVSDLKGENIIWDTMKHRWQVIDTSYILEGMSTEEAKEEYRHDWFVYKGGRMVKKLNPPYSGRVKEFLEELIGKPDSKYGDSERLSSSSRSSLGSRSRLSFDLSPNTRASISSSLGSSSSSNLSSSSRASISSSLGSSSSSSSDFQFSLSDDESPPENSLVGRFLTLQDEIDETLTTPSSLSCSVPVENEPRVRFRVDPRSWANSGYSNFYVDYGDESMHPPCVGDEVRSSYQAGNPNYSLDYQGKVFVPPTDAMWRYYKQHLLKSFEFDLDHPALKSMVVFGTKDDQYVRFPKKYGTLSRREIPYSQRDTLMLENRLDRLNPKRRQRSGSLLRIDIHDRDRMREIYEESGTRVEQAPMLLMVNRFISNKREFFRAYRSGALGEYKNDEGAPALYPKDYQFPSSLRPAGSTFVTDHEIYRMFNSPRCERILKNALFADEKTKFTRPSRRSRPGSSSDVHRRKSDQLQVPQGSIPIPPFLGGIWISSTGATR